MIRKTMDLVIAPVYMPTSQHTDNKLEAYYVKTENITITEIQNVSIEILGDWNAFVGRVQQL